MAPPGRLVTLAIALILAAPALAAAPQPARPVDRSLYSGRWYEIAHTPNAREKDCQAPTSDFVTDKRGELSLINTCHRGGPTGPAKIFTARAAILPGAGGAKFAISFISGLIHQQYWILDHADAGDWAIMATPGGNFVWLLSRRPSMAPAARGQALRRIAALGYDIAHLTFSRQ